MKDDRRARREALLAERAAGSIGNKQFYTRLYSCARKHRYPDRLAADLYAAAWETVRKVRLFVYVCRFCDGWHLTRKTPKVPRLLPVDQAPHGVSDTTTMG
jgi:hypothetical protein